MPPGSHLVILVHGIRTRAAWYIGVRDELTNAGFKVELTNYGRFDLLRFLIPIPFFKSRAAAHIESDIRAAMAHHGVKRASIIAHSFGTYLVAWILKNRPDILFARIIFCGSVVMFRFPFDHFFSRFEDPVLNEVGTKDIWPILAESGTWGYGSTGAFGFKRPGVFDRYHRAVSHSAFLSADFCRHNWIPFLQGNPPQSADMPEDPPWLLRLLSNVQLKYIAIVILAIVGMTLHCMGPQRSVILAPEQIYFAGDKLNQLVSEAERPCSGWCPEIMTRQRCMATTATESAIDNLVLCNVPGTVYTYRDPAEALIEFHNRLASCLKVDGVAIRRLKVSVDRSVASELKATNGKSYWLCGCSDADRDRVRAILNRGE